MNAIKVYAAIVLALGVLFCLTVHYSQRVPLARPDAPLHEFSEHRALNNTKYLAELGFRVVGGPLCDVESVKYLVSVLNDVKVVKGGPLLEVSVQTTSGSFHSDWLHTPITSVFTNITNIIVRLRNPASAAIISPAELRKAALPEDATYNHSLERIETNQTNNLVRSSVSTGYKEMHSDTLKQQSNGKNITRNAIMVSSHYDSTFNSPGASDDGTPVGVMLELIRNFAATPLADSNPANDTPLIFVFNGAEEPGMQAAFGFVAQHPWAPSVRVVINLEAAGAGGRELLFQTGPRNSWIAKAYQRVPNPTGSVVAQDLFQKAKAVPGDTDFSIYRDFGDIPGIDMAFIETGYVYHTRYDDMSHITPGSAQSMGTNVKALVESISSQYLRNETTMSTQIDPDEEPVYFDVLGVWFVVYSVDFAEKLHYTLIAFAATAFLVEMATLHSSVSKISFVASVILSYITTVGTLISGIVSASIFAALMVFVLDWRMSWYGKQHIVFGIFAPAAVIGFVAAQALLRCIVLKPLLASKPASKSAAATTATSSGKASTTAKKTTSGPSTPVKQQQQQQKEATKKQPKQSNDLEIEAVYEASVFWGNQLFSLTLLLTATVFHVASGYVLFLMSLFSLLGRCIVGRLFAKYPAVEHVLSLFFSSLNTMWVSIGLAKFALPIFGRSGPVETDFAAAVVVTFMCFLVLLPRGLSLIQRAGRFLVVALVAAMVASLFVGLALQSFPYSRSAPKRVLAKHVHYLETDTAKVASSYINLGVFDCITMDKIGLVDTLKLGPVEPIPTEVNVREYQMYYPLGAFLSSVKIAVANQTEIAPADRKPSRVTPTVAITSDSTEVTVSNTSALVGVTRNLSVTFHAGVEGVCWAGLNVSATNVVSWTLTDSLPPSTEGFFSIRKIGTGPHSFDISLYNEVPLAQLSGIDVAAEDKTAVMRSVLGNFNVEIVSACFDRFPNDIGFDLIEAKQPVWAAIRAYNCFIRSYAF